MHFGKHTTWLLESRIHFSCQLNAWACREERVKHSGFQACFCQTTALIFSQLCICLLKICAAVIERTCGCTLFFRKILHISVFYFTF